VAPHFSDKTHPVIHVLDASRSVTVVSKLLEAVRTQTFEYTEDILELYEELREEHYDSIEERNMLAYAAAKARKQVVDYGAMPVARAPAVGVGIHVVEGVSLQELVPFIDWSPFFSTWELRGKYPNRGYPKIFNDETVGEAAKTLHGEALELLGTIVDGNKLHAKGIYAILPASRSAGGEDVDVWAAEAEREGGAAPAAKFCMLRQQEVRDGTAPLLSLADFVAPREAGADHLGMFATSIFGAEALAAEFDAQLDDYNKIMAQVRGVTRAAFRDVCVAVPVLPPPSLPASHTRPPARARSLYSAHLSPPFPPRLRFDRFFSAAYDSPTRVSVTPLPPPPPRRSPIASLRHSRRCCTRSCGRSSGGTARTSRSLLTIF
jgi:5-methyltetrahydrofolate--homocysteine methyltransferase